MRSHKERGGVGESRGSAAVGPDIGKRTLVESLPGGGEPLPAAMQSSAEASTGASLGDVRVHTGAASNAAADALGAHAFAQGRGIHFGAGEYRPGTAAGDHLLAHEVVHTIQQGGQPAGQAQAKRDVSEPGDAAEREADRAADSILRGEPTVVSERGPAIARRTKRAAAARPADARTKDTNVERTGKLSNAYGTFTYTIKKNAAASGCTIDLAFKAFSPEVDATKLTIIQTIKNHKGGGAIFYLNNDSAHYHPFDTGDGTYTDHLPGETDPFYNFDDKNTADESTGTTGATTTTMTDDPHINSIAGERGADFETAPFALSGKDKGEFFGTFTWGYAIDAGGAFTLNAAAVHDDITTTFGAALRKFIAREAALTATGTTPAPVALELPLDKARGLTAAEKATLKPIADFAKIKPDARIWATSRYDARGLGADANHQMAMDNVKAVQKALVDLGASEAKIRIAALEEPATPKLNVGVIDVSVINS